MEKKKLPGIVDDIRFYDGVILTEKEIITLFKIHDAVWVCDRANPQAPHAKLRSGKCSNGFFNCMRVLCHPNLCEILAIQLAKKLKEAGIEKVDWVIGSPYAAITFSHEVAKALGAIHAFTEKDPSDPDKKRMIWRRMQIPKDATALSIEELITTSGTFLEVRRAVNQGNDKLVNWLPIVGTLVHRPPELPVNYPDIEQVVSLIETKVWAVEQKDCPLCKDGSPRYEPKTHWAELTGQT